MPKDKGFEIDNLKYVRIDHQDKLPVVSVTKLEDFLHLLREAKKNTLFVKYEGKSKNALNKSFYTYIDGIAYEEVAEGYETLADMKKGTELGLTGKAGFYYVNRAGRLTDDTSYRGTSSISEGELKKIVTSQGYKDYAEFDKSFNGGFYESELALEDTRKILSQGFESLDEFNSFNDSKFKVLKDYRNATELGISEPPMYEMYLTLTNLKSKLKLKTFDQCLMYMIMTTTDSQEIEIGDLMDSLEKIEKPFLNENSYYYGRNYYFEWYTKKYHSQDKVDLMEDLSEISVYSTVGQLDREKGCFRKYLGIPLFIDGSNVAYNNGDTDKGDKSYARNIESLINEAVKFGFSDIKLYHDANLEYKVDDVEILEKIRNEWKTGKVPGKTIADEFIIEFAKKHNGYIVTNDQFRDHLKENPQDEEFIKTHRFSFMIDDDGEVVLSDAKRVKLTPVTMNEEMTKLKEKINSLRS